MRCGSRRWLVSAAAGSSPYARTSFSGFAGAMRVGWLSFLLLNGLGVTIWAGVAIGAGVLFHAGIHELIDRVLARFAQDRNAVLVVDDLQMLVAKQGFPMTSDVIDTIKIHIKRGTLRALFTVDAAEYEKDLSLFQASLEFVKGGRPR